MQEGYLDLYCDANNCRTQVTVYFVFKHYENACTQRVTQVDIVHKLKMRDNDDCIFGSTKLEYLYWIRIKDGWKTAILGIISSSIVVTHNIEISIQSGEKKPNTRLFLLNPPT